MSLSIRLRWLTGHANLFAFSALPVSQQFSRLLRMALRPSLFPSVIHKRVRLGMCPDLEAALHSWINFQFAARRCVNGGLIIKKAQRLHTLMNQSLPRHKRTFLHFSNGWLHNFQRRCNLRSLSSHGESGDADHASIDRELPRLRAAISRFEKADVFNADAFGHFYNLAPDRTIAYDRMPGRKKQKVRLTYLGCCNASGSERLPLMCIGKARKLRCFKNKTGTELGFDYYNNTKAWMTTPLFLPG